MYSDTWAEAEQIVRRISGSTQRQRSEVKNGKIYYDIVLTDDAKALATALAAAMNNHGAHAHHGLCESIGADDETMCDCGTAPLQQALSALRPIEEGA